MQIYEIILTPQKVLINDTWIHFSLFLTFAANFYLFKIHIAENELFILFLKTSRCNFAPRKQRQIINTKKKNYGY